MGQALRPALVVSLMGGLGNQLFQYACGWSLAQRQRRSLWLEQGSVDRDPLRQFALSPYRLKAGSASSGQLQAWGLEPGSVARLRRRLLGTRIATLREQGFAWQALTLPAGEARLLGYWQSERYFAAERAPLKAQFTLRAAPQGPNAALLRRIRAAGRRACALHVRRGDYVADARVRSVHGSLEPAYYRAAWARLRQKVKGAALFVFSDEPAWVRSGLPFLQKAVLVDVNPPSQPHEDLRLMAACRHFILANSSFSWWGAWLGEAPASQVLAPRRWFQDPSRDTRDLLPARWTRLG